ncbi:hypothetical protein CAPTEDRAFT_100527 [Capitella teleta]|uniref:Uncharacterized protein n=1 Tax=Capitella teleta TaxID=283909 RepID=R7U2E8_CAPTE|nr:hypothetical protein CAPTEDRAFT_100527 [Capitella teleta]|eukprot:ELU00180.1 hypothetical protein CAPTEDRAFT_100527 [Capitella teleta]
MSTILLLYFVLGVFRHLVIGENSTSNETCLLPDCYEDRFDIPGGFEREEVPQMVTFTFSGKITPTVRSQINEVFTTSITNSNRCPVSITAFVLGKGSRSCDIHKMFVRGHEIAIQGYNSTWPGSWTTRQWRENTANYRSTLSQGGYVPEEELKGMRAPRQQPGKDEQFKMLADAGFLWDSTLLGGPITLGVKTEWPVTLTSRIPPKFCKNTGFCPEKLYPGLWEVPLLRLANTPIPCSYLDACVSRKDNQLTSTSKIYKVLIDNFDRNYISNRAPFQVNIRVESLNDNLQKEALKDFLHTLSGYEDVWILGISQVIAWMQNPVDKHRALEFGAWDCPDRDYKVECDSDYDSGSSEDGEGEGFAQFIDGNTLLIVQYVLLSVTYILVVVYDRYAHPRDK